MVARDCEVLIIGGGVAGLAAARELDRAGVPFVLVEARARLGGRIHTVRETSWPVPVDLGAEFIHGRPAAIRRLRPRLGSVPDDHRLLRGGRLVDGDSIWEATQELLSDPSGRDWSFAAYLRSRKVDREVRRLATAYVEGFHAADPGRASMRAITEQQRAAEDIHGDEASRPLAGYDSIVSRLACAPERMRLGTTVEGIEWRRGHVEASVKRSIDGRRWRLGARRVILTTPLGATPPFRPRLKAREAAERRLAMGPVVKLALWFRERIWPEKLAFVHRFDAAFPTWWTMQPLDAPIIMGWAGGPVAARLLDRPEPAVVRLGLSTLKRMLGREVAAEVQAHQLARWPCAYSWVPVGAGDAQRVLAQSIDDTLFFAGEATHTEGQSGTVHGAIETGLRAAREVTERLA